jgi:hypothetical protein
MNSQRKNSKDGPIFDCYSNMPLFVYRIRDVILEYQISCILVCTSCDSFITDISSHQNYEFMKENIFSNKKIILFYAISALMVPVYK